MKDWRARRLRGGLLKNIRQSSDSMMWSWWNLITRCHPANIFRLNDIRRQRRAAKFITEIRFSDMLEHFHEWEKSLLLLEAFRRRQKINSRLHSSRAGKDESANTNTGTQITSSSFAYPLRFESWFAISVTRGAKVFHRWLGSIFW